MTTYINVKEIRIVGIIMVCLLAGFIRFSNLAGNSIENARYVPITISSGDTLWAIASRITSEKEDIRKTIYYIKVKNNLSDREYIVPGQTILVPDLKVTADKVTEGHQSTRLPLTVALNR